jgi:DNA-binding XRE family transcriptional regulator
MTIEVRDIASFENSQAVFAHYAAVKKRLRPQRRINLLATPKAPVNIPIVRHPKRRRRVGLTAEQVYQNCRNWLSVCAERNQVSLDFFSARALPLEGLLIQAEFIDHCIYQLGAEYKQLARLLELSSEAVKSIETQYANYRARLGENDCDRSVALHRDDRDPLMRLAVEVALKYRATIEDIMGRSRASYKLMARQEFIYRATHETDKCRFAIGNFIHKDHTSITSGLASHEMRLRAFDALKIEGNS